MNSLQEKYKKA